MPVAEWLQSTDCWIVYKSECLQSTDYWTFTRSECLQSTDCWNGYKAWMFTIHGLLNVYIVLNAYNPQTAECLQSLNVYNPQTAGWLQRSECFTIHRLRTLLTLLPCLDSPLHCTALCTFYFCIFAFLYSIFIFIHLLLFCLFILFLYCIF